MSTRNWHVVFGEPEHGEIIALGNVFMTGESFERDQVRDLEDEQD